MTPPTTTLHLVLYPEQLSAFFPFLQAGVTIRALIGCTVSSLLVQQFGISPEYIRSRITTLFLDSRAIDNAETAVVRDGSVLALSGAMPGLVGATLRSGGYYAAMRSSISYDSMPGGEPVREGTLRIKLFNLLLSELGPVLLREGILLAGSDLTDFFAAREEDFWRGCRKALLNGQPIDQAQLREGNFLPPGNVMVRLTISFRGRV